MPSTWLNSVPEGNIENEVKALDPKTCFSLLETYLKEASLADDPENRTILALLCKQISTSNDPRLQLDYKRLLSNHLSAYLKISLYNVDVHWLVLLLNQGALVTNAILEFTALNTASDILKILLEQGVLGELNELDQGDNETLVQKRDEWAINEGFQQVLLTAASGIKSYSALDPKCVEHLLDYLAPRLVKEWKPSVFALIKDHLVPDVADIIQEYPFDTYTFKNAVTDALIEALSTGNKAVILMLLQSEKYSGYIDFNAPMHSVPNGRPLLMALYAWMQRLGRNLTAAQRHFLYQLPYIHNIDITTQKDASNRTLFTTWATSDTDRKDLENHLANLLNILYKQKGIRVSGGKVQCSSEELSEWTGISPTVWADLTKFKLGNVKGGTVSNLTVVQFLFAINPPFTHEDPSLQVLILQTFLKNAVSNNAQNTYEYLRRLGSNHLNADLKNIVTVWLVNHMPIASPFFQQFLNDFLADNAENRNLQYTLIDAVGVCKCSKLATSLLSATHPELIGISVVERILETCLNSYSVKEESELELTSAILDFLTKPNVQLSLYGSDYTLTKILAGLLEQPFAHVLGAILENKNISDETLAKVLLARSISRLTLEDIALILEERPKINMLLAEYFIEKLCASRSSPYWEERLAGEPISLEEIIVHMQGFHTKKSTNLFSTNYSGKHTQDYFFALDKASCASYFHSYQGPQEGLTAWFCQTALLKHRSNQDQAFSLRIDRKLAEVDFAPMPLAQPTTSVIDLAKKWKDPVGDWHKQIRLANGKTSSLVDKVHEIKDHSPKKYKKICGAENVEDLEKALGQHRNLFFRVFGRAIGKKTTSEQVYSELTAPKQP
jgi:hypothetical protein